jgi:hypothetical protein
MSSYYKVGKGSLFEYASKDKKVWVLWFPVQDIVYVKEDVLYKTSE